MNSVHNGRGVLPSHGDAAQRLMLAPDEVAALHRRAQLGDLALMLAHELNNLMTPLVARAEFVLKRGTPQDHAVALERVLVQARRATDVAQRLLDFGRGRDVAFQARQLRGLIAEAVATLPRPLEKDGHELIVDVPDEIQVRAAGDLLVQLFFNLLLNSRAAFGDRSGRITFRAHSEDDHVIVRVSDNGPGLAADAIENTFNPFLAALPEECQHNRLSPEGVGVGWRICRHIAQIHGGAMRLEANPGVGLTVELRLPVA